MKINFFTIVYNGNPWIRGQAEFLRQLEGVDWWWHVVEGLAEHVKDTAWCKEAGGRLPESGERKSESRKKTEPEKRSLSTDGTREFLDELKKEFGDRVSIYRPPGAEPWPGKKAMIDIFLPQLEDGCLLWQLDVDEFWKPGQVLQILAEFEQRPELTAGWFDCDYFFGWDRCSSRPGVFGNFREFEWLRVWRYRKGDQWDSHEPPALMRVAEDGKRKNVGGIYPMHQDETRAKGWRFQHYAMTDRAQMEFKEIYYGHRGLIAGLDQLGKASRSEPLARSLFPHILDKEIGAARTLRTFWRKITSAFQPGARAEDARKAGTLPIAQMDIRGQVRFTFDERKGGQPASILMIRADRIGDQILFLPFLASLRKQLPFTQLHLAVPEDVAPIYQLWGEVDRLHTFRRAEGHRSAGYRNKLLGRMPGHFEWVILPAFNGEKLSYKLASRMEAKRKVGFAGEFRGVKARHRCGYEKIVGEKVPVPNPDIHELEKYRLLLQHLGLKPEIDLPSIRTVRDDRPKSADRKKSNPRIILAVGTVNPIKEYPRWAEVVASLSAKLNPEWVLVGGKGEKTPPDLIQALLPKARDLREQTSLEELSREILAADLFLGVDTGPAHLALALGKPAVVVLGGGDYGRFFPYGKSRVVTHPMNCFQCHWECRYDRALCLHDIQPAQVAREVLEIATDLP
jgi:ADP-heptose:LPS heptosyltransferase